MAWVPVLFGIAVICGESTNTMGAVHTSLWLTQLVSWAGHPDGPVALLNHLLRKSGHFTGYGLLGICFARGWFSLLRRHMSASWSALRLRAGALAILSTAVVASADEIHQIFLPTRGASVEDVLLDTSGAVVLNVLFFAVLALRRSSLMNPQAPFTTLGLSFAELPTRISNAREVRVLKTKSARRLAGLRRGIHSKPGWTAPDFIASRRVQ
jgi:VanZ family protein